MCLVGFPPKPKDWETSRPNAREILFYDAHTHLQMTGRIKGEHEEDHWESDSGVQMFTEADNPD